MRVRHIGIVCYTGDNTAPLELPFLEQWVDEMTNAALWTCVQPDISALSNGTATPLISLERGPNFGFGSVYKVAAFEDGTVVYTGIANVDKIGIQVFKIDTSVIISIAQRTDLRIL